MSNMNLTQRNHIVQLSFIGDALSLGPHWIYQQSEIERKAGAVSGYLNPISEYHPGKEAGDFTHYGDQALVLLRSISKAKHFNLSNFANEWRSFWEDDKTTSYKDGATKATLRNLQENHPVTDCASSSSDMAGASRMAPLFLLQWDSEETLLSAVREQTAFTHGDSAVIESAEFFARVALHVAAGRSIPESLNLTAEMGHWTAIQSEWMESAARSSASGESVERSAEALGLTCHVSDAFPVIVDLLLRFPLDPVAALTKNAQAGGDSAARAMILGLTYGALPEASKLPETWLTELKARDEIEQLIKELS